MQLHIQLLCKITLGVHKEQSRDLFVGVSPQSVSVWSVRTCQQ